MGVGRIYSIQGGDGQKGGGGGGGEGIFLKFRGSWLKGEFKNSGGGGGLDPG